jgi:hypothetical protein
MTTAAMTPVVWRWPLIYVMSHVSAGASSGGGDAAARRVACADVAISVLTKA